MFKDLEWLKNSFEKTIEQSADFQAKKTLLTRKASLLKELIELLNVPDFEINIKKISQYINYVYSKEEATSIIGTIKYIVKLKEECLKENTVYSKKKMDSFNEFLKNITDYVRTSLEEAEDKINKIEAEYSSALITKCKEILSKLAATQSIIFDDMEFIKDYLLKHNATRMEIGYIFTAIADHNQFAAAIARDVREKNAVADTGIFDLGYEKLDIPSLGDAELDFRNDTESGNYFEFILENNTEKMIELLDIIYENSKNDFEYNRTLLNILTLFQKKLFDNQGNMKYELYFNDRESRCIILAEYNDVIKKYRILRDYHNNFEANLNAKSLEEVPIKERNDSVNNLIFLYPPNSRKNIPYFEKEFYDLPVEVLETVKYLLEGMRSDSFKGTTKLESLTSNLSGFLKLKDGQIRIPIKHIGGNNYLILGVDLKKSNAGDKMYATITSRYHEIEPSEEVINDSRLIYDRIIEYINEKLKKRSK